VSTWHGITLATPLPWWALLLLAGVLAWLAAITYAGLPLARHRRATLAGLRFVILLAVVLFLLRPVIFQPTPSEGLTVPVVIDASRSMAIRDVAAEGAGAEPQTRFEHAVALTRGLLARELGGFRVELLELREDTGPLNTTRGPDADASPLAEAMDALRERYRDRAVPGIVLLSDGVETGAGAGVGDQSGLPVFTIPVGSDTPPVDQEVVALDLEAHALPGSTLDLTATVVSRGFGRDPFVVRLLAGGRPLDVQRVVPIADGLPVRVTFSLPPAGDEPVVYTVNIPARIGDLATENNARHAVVQPMGRPRRLLFVQGAPGYEHSFLARAWHGDPRLDLDSVVRKGHNERGDATFYIQADGGRGAALTTVLPADRAQLFAYDAIIFGNAPHDLLNEGQLSAVEAFVNHRGGGLLVFGGQSFGTGGLASTPLGSLLPLSPRQAFSEAARASWSGAAGASLGSEGPNRLALTHDGERHPLLRLGSSPAEGAKRWRAAPPLAGVAALGEPRPGAQVLAVASSGGVARPVLAVQRYGEGRTMVFAGEATWRWKMQQPLDDRLFDTFWRQVARWLSAPAPEPVVVDVSADPQPGRASTVSVLVRDERFEPIRDAAVEIAVRDERGTQDILRATLQDAARGRYTAEWRPGGSGLFSLSATARRAAARLASSERAVYAGGADLETADPRRQDEVLRRLADRTGGQMLLPSEITRLGGLLQARAAAAAVPAPRELWHGPWTFLTLIALLGTEWALRRRWGLR
jgi:hypothetical protein